MRKILIIAALIATICSCGNTNKEYCSACDSELCSICIELSLEYSLREFAYQTSMSELQNSLESAESWMTEYYIHRDKIERLERDKKHYELEIKKYSKKWEFSESTQRAYERLDSVMTSIYGTPEDPKIIPILK